MMPDLPDFAPWEEELFCFPEDVPLTPEIEEMLPNDSEQY